MNSFTIRNLRETEDSAPSLGVDSAQEIRFAGADLEAERTGVSLMSVKPGRRQAVAHRHDEAEEVYVILAGTGRVKLDDEVHEVAPLDAVRVAPHVTRAFEAGPDGLEYLAFGPRHDADGEVVSPDEFWEQPSEG